MTTTTKGKKVGKERGRNLLDKAYAFRRLFMITLPNTICFPLGVSFTLKAPRFA